MNTQLYVTAGALETLVARHQAAGVRVVCPRPRADGAIDYRELAAGEPLGELIGAGMPRGSLKRFFLPPTEPLFRWTRTKDDIDLQPATTDERPLLVLGAKPCDAAALPVVDRVMDWDYRDEAWFRRREAATVVTLACGAPDAACFCTSVGAGPSSLEGSDVLLVPVAGGWIAELVTGRGVAFAAANPEAFQDAPAPAERDAIEFAARAREAVEHGSELDPVAVRRWTAAHFDDPAWDTIARRCHGCGACAAVCPTCHCFDIVDEPEGMRTGTRRRNWDTCQAAKFTLHASGHNPRATQNARLRQRVLHKFAIYPERFGRILCTGCGRCSRSCPAGTNLVEVLASMAEATP